MKYNPTFYMESELKMMNTDVVFYFSNTQTVIRSKILFAATYNTQCNTLNPFLPKSQILCFSLMRNSFCSNKRRRFPHACACFVSNKKRSTSATKKQPPPPPTTLPLPPSTSCTDVDTGQVEDGGAFSSGGFQFEFGWRKNGFSRRLF